MKIEHKTPQLQRGDISERFANQFLIKMHTKFQALVFTI
jgi:hypothetical protein